MSNSDLIKYRAQAFKYLIGIVIILTTLEMGLRLSGRYKTHSERVTGEYQNDWNRENGDWYWTWGPNHTFDYIQKEFTYTNRMNSEGVREFELYGEGSEDTIRIITIGDSFTEGDGAPYDSAYPRFIEYHLNNLEKGKRVYQVYNAGVCGSDPFYYYTLLRDRLLKYHPQLVIVALNSGEIEDILFRGGMERFHADGSTKYKKGPWFEPLFRKSHLVRFFVQSFGYNEQLIKPESKAMQEAISRMAESIELLAQLCDSNDTDVVFFTYPMPYQIDFC